jgi:hypothetical protein
MSETKTAKNGLETERPGLEVNITECQTWQILCHAMDNPLYDCMSVQRVCTKHSLRQFILCCISIFAILPMSRATAERTFSVLKYSVSEVIYEIIDRRGAPRWVGFDIHSS